MSFEFTEENSHKARSIIAEYPESQSAVLPLLHLAQDQNGNWLSRDAIEYVASILALPPLHVWEVVHFYTMFRIQPVGTYHIEVCTTVPCFLCGGPEVLKAFEEQLGIKAGETTPDQMFTLSEVECLGACTQASAIQINGEFLENIKPDMVSSIIASKRHNH